MDIAVITGASSGLGIEFLKETVSNYPDLDEIWLIARRKDKLEELSSMIKKPFCRALPMDLSLEGSYSELEKLLGESKADVRLLVNNAGFGKLGNIADMDIRSQTSMVDLNCRGLTGVASACLKHMTKGAQIINICSIASFCPNSRLTVYSSTKAYVMSFSRGLREELKPKGINCISVCPGPMRTEFMDVAEIAPGSSKTFDTLPYCNAHNVAKNSLKASAKGRAVYTNKIFYKFYRLLAKLLPHSLMMKLSKA